MRVFQLTNHDDIDAFFPTKREVFAAAKVYFGDEGDPGSFEIREVELGAITSRVDACALLNRKGYEQHSVCIHSTGNFKD